MMTRIWAIGAIAMLGCAGQGPEQGRHVAELERRIHLLEVDRDSQQDRVVALEAKLAEARVPAGSGAAAGGPGQTPLLRVVRLEPSAMPEAAPEEVAPVEEATASEHVVLSGTGSQFSVETRKADGEPVAPRKAEPAAGRKVKP